MLPMGKNEANLYFLAGEIIVFKSCHNYTKNTYIYYKLEGTENIWKTYQIKALQVE